MRNSAKAKRVPFIAVNGILLLIPAAFFLLYKAQAGDFDTSFYAVQGAELLAGAANPILLGLNMIDGLKMKGRLGRESARSINKVATKGFAEKHSATAILA